LNEDKDRSSDNWDEVQGQVHNISIIELGWYICKTSQNTVPNERLWSKFLERRLEELSKLQGVSYHCSQLFQMQAKVTLLIESVPDLSWRPSETTPVSFLDTKTPSKVSTKASAIKKFFESTVMRVELSLRINSTVVNAARGPFTKKSTDTRTEVISSEGGIR
jgi:hypothetical protein